MTSTVFCVTKVGRSMSIGTDGATPWFLILILNKLVKARACKEPCQPTSEQLVGV